MKAKFYVITVVLTISMVFGLSCLKQDIEKQIKKQDATITRMKMAEQA